MHEQFGGKQAAIAARLGRQADYISRIFTGRKMLAEDLAREFEDALGKPAYWLDGLDEQAETAWPFTVSKQDYDSLDEEDRAALDRTLSAFVAGTLARYSKDKNRPDFPVNPATAIKPSRNTMDDVRRSMEAAEEAVQRRSSHGSGAPAKRRGGVSG
jgi:plasmid maintenance system antidote protein VapI